MSWMLCLLLGLGVLFNILWLSEHKSKLNLGGISIFIISILHTLVGVFSVKVFAFIESGTAGGMSLYGAIFFMPVVYYLGSKIFNRSIADVFDIFAICMIFTLLCARVNCLFSGCCLGLPIPGFESLLWPTRQFEIIFYVILLVVLGLRVEKKPCQGTIYPIYMMSYGAFRFIIEWARESDNTIGFLHISHVWSIIALFIGVCVYINILKYKEGNAVKKKEGKKKCF